MTNDNLSDRRRRQFAQDAANVGLRTPAAWALCPDRSGKEPNPLRSSSPQECAVRGPRLAGRAARMFPASVLRE